LVLVAQLEQQLLVLPVMEHQAETQSFIHHHIIHIPQLNLFVELEEVEQQVLLEEMVLLLLEDQVVVEVEKILMEQQIILPEQQ
tara:strand:- start:297 stop:548 length:252 start_codon:yes stop_codon:yes gene_type:complete